MVIWFSDDPSLNEQTRFRLMESSDRLRHTDLVVVENTFNRAKFEAGKIYFLNTQKLGKNSLLVRGFDGDDGTKRRCSRKCGPTCARYTIWDTIRNTIEDPALTLYLVLDEAHRGMGNPSNAARREDHHRQAAHQRRRTACRASRWCGAFRPRWNDSTKAMEGAQRRSTLPHCDGGFSQACRIPAY